MTDGATGSRESTSAVIAAASWWRAVMIASRSTSRLGLVGITCMSITSASSSTLRLFSAHASGSTPWANGPLAWSSRGQPCTRLRARRWMAGRVVGRRRRAKAAWWPHEKVHRIRALTESTSANV
jgi:hypothetical protein